MLKTMNTVMVLTSSTSMAMSQEAVLYPRLTDNEVLSAADVQIGLDDASRLFNDTQNILFDEYQVCLSNAENQDTKNKRILTSMGSIPTKVRKVPQDYG